jgi:hypothetical protein
MFGVFMALAFQNAGSDSLQGQPLSPWALPSLRNDATGPSGRKARPEACSKSSRTRPASIRFACEANRAQTPVPDAETMIGGMIKRREDGYYRLIEQRLGKSPYLAGPEFTCADIMVTFALAALPLFGGRAIDDLPNTNAYVERTSKRPAYVKAMAIAGPAAVAPVA